MAKKIILSVLLLFSTTILMALSAGNRDRLEGKKLVTLGDSFAESCAWQPYLCKWFDLVWSNSERSKRFCAYCYRRHWYGNYQHEINFYTFI